MANNNLTDLKQKSIQEHLPEASLHVMQVLRAEMNALEHKLSSKLSSYVRDCGHHTTAGGAVFEEILTSRAKPGMHAVACLEVEGAVPVTITTVAVEAGKIVVTFSADPDVDHELSWVLFC